MLQTSFKEIRRRNHVGAYHHILETATEAKLTDATHTVITSYVLQGNKPTTGLTFSVSPVCPRLHVWTDFTGVGGSETGFYSTDDKTQTLQKHQGVAVRVKLLCVQAEEAEDHRHKDLI